jgi:hypothetical protein
MRRAVILEKTGEDDNTRILKVVFWYPIPTARKGFYAKPGYVSILADRGVLAPTTQEAAALQDGSVVEEYDNVPLLKKGADGKPLGKNAFLTAATDAIQAIYQARMAELENYNPWLLYGSTYADETGGWTLKTVADITTGSLTPGVVVTTTTTAGP